MGTWCVYFELGTVSSSIIQLLVSHPNRHKTNQVNKYVSRDTDSIAPTCEGLSFRVLWNRPSGQTLSIWKVLRPTNERTVCHGIARSWYPIVTPVPHHMPMLFRQQCQYKHQNVGQTGKYPVYLLWYMRVFAYFEIGLLARHWASGKSCDRPTKEQFAMVLLGPGIQLLPQFHIILRCFSDSSVSTSIRT
jgi:hypothetical protein